MGNNDNLSITLLGDDDLVGEIADTALNLDPVVEELLERRDVEDLVLSRGAAVDDELVGLLSSLGLLQFRQSQFSYLHFCIPEPWWGSAGQNFGGKRTV